MFNKFQKLIYAFTKIVQVSLITFETLEPLNA